MDKSQINMPVHAVENIESHLCIPLPQPSLLDNGAEMCRGTCECTVHILGSLNTLLKTYWQSRVLLPLHRKLSRGCEEKKTYRQRQRKGVEEGVIFVNANAPALQLTRQRTVFCSGSISSFFSTATTCVFLFNTIQNACLPHYKL